jgi:peptidoglycan hydrolase-like protein with peptidoglycan-binding domain
MKRIILATVASAALCLPALAQQGQPDQSTQATQQTQPNANAPLSQNGSPQMTPGQLSGNQVREIQQALDNKGFKAGRADGKWGPETEAAFKDFQKSQNLPSSGNIDAMAVAALGLHTSDFGMSVGTTGQAPSGGNRQAPNADNLNAAPPRQSAPGPITPPNQSAPSAQPNSSGDQNNR